MMLAEQRQACLNSRGNDFAQAVSSYLYLLSSEQRGPEMVSLLECASAESYWKVFLEHWPGCDDTWSWKEQLLSQLRKIASQGSVVPYYDNDQRVFFESLPETVTIYRGCSRNRVGGLSWTTSVLIAEQFARGHRAIGVRDPVIVTAEVSKNEVFAVFTVRGEAEIICAPSRILKLESCR